MNNIAQTIRHFIKNTVWTVEFVFSIFFKKNYSKLNLIPVSGVMCSNKGDEEGGSCCGGGCGCSESEE